MSLSYSVLRFIDRVRRKPVLGTDPDELKALEGSALNSFDGAFVALHAPMAPDTYEARGMLLSGSAESDLLSMRFPSRVQIVGMLPTIVPYGAQGRRPTLDDIDVSMSSFSGKTNLTSATGITTPAGGGKDGTFVTLSGMSVQAPRLHGIRLDAPTPEVHWKFRWKLGPGTYQDAIVTMLVFARPLP